MRKLLVICLQKLSLLSAVSLRLTKLTGKAAIPTHPKHLVDFGQWYYLASLEASDRVLDLGCHSGEHSFKAASKVKEVIGVDIDHRLLKLARHQAQRLKITNVSFTLHNLETKLPFAKNSFDKVFFFAVLEHLHRRSPALREIKRVLKPKGYLFISVPNKATGWKKLQRTVGLPSFSDPDHKVEFSRRQIIALLKRHRFTPLVIKPAAYDTPFSGVIDLLGGISLTLYRYLMHFRLKAGLKSPQNSVGFLITAAS